MKQNNHLRRFQLNSCVICTVLTLVLLFTFIRFCVKLPSYGETYQGRLSPQSYSSIERAAHAFLADEIDSQSKTSSYISCKSLKKLSEKQIEALNLSEEFREVEQVEVTYKIGEQTYTKKIYACYLENDGYKYFSPPLYTGEDLTKSYYDSIRSSTDFQNFSLNLQQISSVNLFGIPVKSELNYTMQIADGLAYYKDEIHSLGFSLTREIYCFDTPSGIKGVLKETQTGTNPTTGEVGGEQPWQLAEVILPFGTAKNISEFSLFGLYEGMDHSFFEKTKTGFAPKPSRREEFTAIVLENLIERSFTASDIFGDSSETKEFVKKLYSDATYGYDCNYIVDDGHLKQTYIKQHVDFKQVDWQKYFEDEEIPDWFYSFVNAFSIDSSLKCDIVNVNKTSFSVPAEVFELIARYN